jgi:hypothetical protein
VTLPNTEEDEYYIMDEIHALAQGTSDNRTKEYSQRRKFTTSSR